MLGILLLILKIIGIIILSLILLIIICLFVPVRLKVKGTYLDKVIQGNAGISYFLHIISLRIGYIDNNMSLKIRIFGIPLALKKHKKAKIKSDDSTLAPKETAQEEKNEALSQEDNIPVREKKSICDKITDTYKTFEYYWKLYQKSSTQKALEVIKSRIGIMLKSVFRFKGHIILDLGLENCGTCGKILGAYKALYDYIGRLIVFHPHFDRECLECKVNIRGKIYPIVIIYQALRIYFNKYCNRLFKLIKNKGKD